MTPNDKPQKILAGILIAAFFAVGVFGIYLLWERIDRYRLLQTLPKPLHAEGRRTAMVQIGVLGAALGLWLLVLILSLRRYVAWCRPGTPPAP